MRLHFIGPIYGGMGPVDVPENAPPMFNVIATDDFLFRGQVGVIDSWFKAGKFTCGISSLPEWRIWFWTRESQSNQ